MDLNIFNRNKVINLGYRIQRSFDKKKYLGDSRTKNHYKSQYPYKTNLLSYEY